MKWNEKSKGFGDTVAKVTQLTGIKSVVDTVSKKLFTPVGCFLSSLNKDKGFVRFLSSV